MKTWMVMNTMDADEDMDGDRENGR